MGDPWNAFIREDLAMEPLGRGNLSGTTFAVKDVFAVRGHASAAGNPDWLRTHPPADDTAPSILRLLGAGARLKGAAHTDELMYSLNGQNVHYGTPVNPRCPGRIPGGSSSGSAVAVAAGLRDFALGTDTGGSVRVPSSYCGIYGFRPTHGAVSAEGVIPLAPSFDTVGWMASCPRLLRDVGEVLLDGPAARSGKRFRRFLFPKEAWRLVDPKTRSRLERFAGEAGISLRDGPGAEWTEVSSEGLAEWAELFRRMQGIEIWSTHGRWIESHRPRFAPDIAGRLRWASVLNPDDYPRLVVRRQEIRRRLKALLGNDGLLVLPTAPGPAPLAGWSEAEREAGRAALMQLTCIAGLAGFPQLTVPAGEVDGAPVGLSWIAGAGMDVALLDWAASKFGAREEEDHVHDRSDRHRIS